MWMDTANKQVNLYDGTSFKTIPSVVATTKGDTSAYTGTVWQVQAVGSNGTVLTADNTQSAGVKWAAVAGGAVIADSPLTGDGSSGSHLACATCTTASNTQVFTNKSISGSTNTLTNIPNSALTNSSMTFATAAPITGAATISLGGTLSLACATCINGTPSAVGDILYSTLGGSAVTALADVATNNVLLSGGVGAPPSYGKVANAALSNSSFTATTAAPLGGGATISLGGTLALTCTTCINGAPSATGDLLYSTSGGTAISPLADIATNNVLLSGGVGSPPSYGKVPNAALTSSSITVNTSAPVTGGGAVSLGGSLTLACATCINGSPSAIGDLLYSTSGGAAVTALADVVAGSYLRSGGTATAPLWSTLTLPNAATTGDILTATGTNAIGRLATGTTSQVLLGGTSPAWGQVGISQLSATGTPSSTTFLRGDNTWATPAGGSTGNFTFSTNTQTLTQALALGTTIPATPNVLLDNSTAAAAAAQQISPSLEQCGRGWKTTATAASQTACVGTYTLPVQGTANPTVANVWYTTVNGGTRTARLHFNWDGTLAGIFAGTSGLAGITMSASEVALFDASGSQLEFNATNLFGTSSHLLGLGATGHSWAQAVVQAVITANTAKPTCAVGTGAGAGAACAVTAGSTDGAGSFAITTAGAPAAASIIATLTFHSTYNIGNTEKAVCIIAPADVNSAGLGATSQAYVPASTFASATFVAQSNAIGLVTGTVYTWNYMCTGATNAY